MKARGGKPADLWQRFGYFSEAELGRLRDLRTQGGVMWIHAVSVGEVGIAIKLIRELHTRQPELGIVVTTTTPTGLGQVADFASKHEGRVLPLYSSLDGWFTVRRFLRAIQPAQLVLVEAEVWPNLVQACHRRGIPVSLVNARLSPRSERRFRKFRSLVEPIYSLLSTVGVQERGDVERFSGALGIRPESVAYTGSIKFDTVGEREPTAQVAAFRALLSGIGITEERPILLAASTHAGEEMALAEVCMRLREEVRGLYLILVPRHAERAGEIEQELQDQGLTVLRRSRLTEGTSTEVQNAGDVLIVDSTGELRAWQYLATVVVIGKSFLATGGQNPAEAVMAGRPVVTGPHMENFDALMQLLLHHQGAVQVADMAALEPALLALLTDSEKSHALAEAGRKALTPHAGATARTADFLL